MVLYRNQNVAQFHCAERVCKMQMFDSVSLKSPVGDAPSGFCEVGANNISGTTGVAAVECGWPILWKNLFTLGLTLGLLCSQRLAFSASGSQYQHHFFINFQHTIWRAKPRSTKIHADWKCEWSLYDKHQCSWECLLLSFFFIHPLTFSGQWLMQTLQWSLSYGDVTMSTMAPQITVNSSVF